jgi:CopG family nickel-responsive transcriptional regulator
MEDAMEHELTRFGVSMPETLIAQFDHLIEKRGYSNRSEAIRDLIRDAIVQERVAAPKGSVVGALTLVYSHLTRELGDRLTELQHKDHGAIISSLHVHLDAHNCLEVIILKGKAARVKKIADSLISMRGVKHGKLSLTAA